MPLEHFVFIVNFQTSSYYVSLLCVAYVYFAWKGHLRNDLYCVGRDVKPYSLMHALTHSPHTFSGYSL